MSTAGGQWQPFVSRTSIAPCAIQRLALTCGRDVVNFINSFTIVQCNQTSSVASDQAISMSDGNVPVSSSVLLGLQVGCACAEQPMLQCTNLALHGGESRLKPASDWSSLLCRQN